MSAATKDSTNGAADRVTAAVAEIEQRDRNRPRGWGDLPCPRCGNVGDLAVLLGNLQQFHCASCGEDFAAADVRQLMVRWGKLLSWVESAPALPVPAAPPAPPPPDQPDATK